MRFLIFIYAGSVAAALGAMTGWWLWAAML